jgi:hypothetical protein
MAARFPQKFCEEVGIEVGMHHGIGLIDSDLREYRGD